MSYPPHDPGEPMRHSKKVRVTSLFFVLGMLMFGVMRCSGVAEAAPAATSMVQQVQAQTAADVQARRNDPCYTNRLCLYQCHLNQACPSGWSIEATNTSCINVFAEHLSIYSVKNTSSYRFKVFKTSNCTGVNSYFYANSSGDMNWEWEGSAIGSVKRG